MKLLLLPIYWILGIFIYIWDYVKPKIKKYLS